MPIFTRIKIRSNMFKKLAIAVALFTATFAEEESYSDDNQEFQSMFESYDKDSNGLVTQEELISTINEEFVTEETTEEELAEIQKSIDLVKEEYAARDADGDGLDYDEFVRLLNEFEEKAQEMEEALNAEQDISEQ